MIITFPFSCACSCARSVNTFLVKTENDARTRDASVILPTNQSTDVRGSFVVLPRWRRQKEVLKKGLQKWCDSSLLFIIMVRFRQIQGACACSSVADSEN